MPGLFYVQDERYAAGAGMRRSGAYQIAYRLKVFPTKCTTNPVCRGRRDAQERRLSDCTPTQGVPH